MPRALDLPQSAASTSEPKPAVHRWGRSRFDRANLVIRSMVVLAVEVLGGLAVLFVHLNCPAIDGLELSLFGAERSVA